MTNELHETSVIDDVEQIIESLHVLRRDYPKLVTDARSFLTLMAADRALYEWLAHLKHDDEKYRESWGKHKS